LYKKTFQLVKLAKQN